MKYFLAAAMFAFANYSLARGILLESNDAGEKIYQDIEEDRPMGIGYFDFNRTFEQVTKVITEDVESEFDIYAFVNVAPSASGSPGDYIPPQHMKLIRKKPSNRNWKTKVFNRNGNGQIDPEYPFADRSLGMNRPFYDGMKKIFKVSSGAPHMGGDYVNTFSGVFRVNSRKTVERRHQKGMINAVYVDIVYANGSESGIAIHGTPDANYKALGRRASHGCVRTHQSVSHYFWGLVMNDYYFQRDLMDFSKTELLPVGPLRNSRPGQRVLLVFFNGYNGMGI